MNDPIIIASEVPELAFHQIVAAWDALPESVRDVVVDGGYKITVARRLADVYPEIAYKHPRGYPEGTTYRNSEGYCDRDQRQIVICQQRLDGCRYINSARLAGALRHEAGHAYYACVGASASAVFRDAYFEDTCSGESPPYFLLDGAAGREEAFAEVFAQRLGGGSTQNLRGAFAAVNGMIARILRDGPSMLDAGVLASFQPR